MLTPPILDNKDASSPSVFVPSALLREARRQKNLATVQVPPVCLLDPDGDIVRTLRKTGKAKPFAGWPCYHTELDTFSLGRARGGDCWPRRGSLKLRAVVGASWTTDGPFRETEEAIEAARAKGILAVEMEAAALYAFARTARVRLLFQDFGFALSPSSTRRRTASDRVGLSSCFSAHLTIAARVAGSADSRLGSYAGRGSPRTTEVMKRRRRSILADGGA